MMENFHYKKGLIEVVNPWGHPSKEKFEKWLRNFLLIDGVENYKVWLGGGFLMHKKDTWDIDITLTGTFINYDNLSNIMIEGTRIGFEKYNMLFDIQHWNIRPIFYPEKRLVKKLVFYNKIIKNNKIITDWTGGRKLAKNLWEIKRMMPNSKQQYRIDNGYVYRKSICLN